MSCICTCRKRIFKIRGVQVSPEMHLYDSPLRESRAAREPELPGAPAVGTSLGHLSHITAKSKKLPENGVNYCLPKIVMKGEETQSWVRPPYASSHRELLEGPVFTLLTADFFFLRKGHSHSTYCLPFVCSIVYHPKEQQIHLRFTQRCRQSSFPLSLD